MIALLFMLLLVAMLLSWHGHRKPALAVFGVTMAIAIYWFHFHATDQLNIML